VQLDEATGALSAAALANVAAVPVGAAAGSIGKGIADAKAAAETVSVLVVAGAFTAPALANSPTGTGGFTGTDRTMLSTINTKVVDEYPYTLTATAITSTVSAGAVVSDPLTAYQNGPLGPFTITVVDENGDPIDLTDHDLSFVTWLEDEPDTLIDDLTTDDGDISVSTNVVTVENAAPASTASRQRLKYALRDDSDNHKVLAINYLRVQECGVHNDGI
jgi:hypothetical protein